MFMTIRTVSLRLSLQVVFFYKIIFFYEFPISVVVKGALNLKINWHLYILIATHSHKNDLFYGYENITAKFKSLIFITHLKNVN